MPPDGMTFEQAQAANNGGQQSTAEPQAEPAQSYGEVDRGGIPRDAHTRAMANYADWRSRGYSVNDALGMVASAHLETKNLPGTINSIGAEGAYQWLGPRTERYIARYGHPPSQGTMAENNDFVHWENQNTEKDAGWAAVQRAANNPFARARAFRTHWERPANPHTQPEETAKEEANVEAAVAALLPAVTQYERMRNQKGAASAKPISFEDAKKASAEPVSFADAAKINSGKTGSEEPYEGTDEQSTWDTPQAAADATPSPLAGTDQTSTWDYDPSKAPLPTPTPAVPGDMTGLLPPEEQAALPPEAAAAPVAGAQRDLQTWKWGMPYKQGQPMDVLTPEQTTAEGYANSAAHIVPSTGTAIAGVGRSYQRGEVQGQRRMINAMDLINEGKEPEAMRSLNETERGRISQYLLASPEQRQLMRGTALRELQENQLTPNAAVRLGKGIEAEGNRLFPMPQNASMGQKTVAGVSGMVPMMGAAAAGAMVAGPVGGVAAILPIIGGQAYEDTYQDAIAHGATEDHAHEAAGLNAVGQMGLMSGPWGTWLRTHPSLVPGLSNAIFNMAKRGAEFGSVSAIAKLTDNFIAKHEYDDKRDLMEGVAEAAQIGAATGGVLAVPGVARGIRHDLQNSGRLAPAFDQFQREGPDDTTSEPESVRAGRAERERRENEFGRREAAANLRNQRLLPGPELPPQTADEFVREKHDDLVREAEEIKKQMAAASSPEQVASLDDRLGDVETRIGSLKTSIDQLEPDQIHGLAVSMGYQVRRPPPSEAPATHDPAATARTPDETGKYPVYDHLGRIVGYSATPGTATGEGVTPKPGEEPTEGGGPAPAAAAPAPAAEAAKPPPDRVYAPAPPAQAQLPAPKVRGKAPTPAGPAIALPGHADPKERAPAPTADGTYVMVDPRHLTLDPKRFQYKESDENGVTGLLANEKRWESDLASPITAWQSTDGQLYVVNGHQRTDLALRAQAGGQDVQMPARVYREADGYTPEYMRVLGAFQNMAEGTGNAIDAARVLRGKIDVPEGRSLPQLPMRNPIVQQATALAKLNDHAFGMVENGLVPAAYAAHVPDFIHDPAGQSAAMGILAKANPPNSEQARILIEDIKNAGFLKGLDQSQGKLFDDEAFDKALFPERARILDNAQKTIRRVKSAFNAAVTGEETLTGAGNQLNTEANAQGKSDNERLLEVLKTDGTKVGPISDALNVAARELADGKPIGGAVARFLTEARRIVREGPGEGVRPSPDVGSEGPPSQAPEVKPEATPKPQAGTNLFGETEPEAKPEAPKPPEQPTLPTGNRPPEPVTPVAAPTPGLTLREGFHAKKNVPLHVVTLDEKVPRERYEELRDLAKKHGGYYSAFKGNGAIPGFQFEDIKGGKAQKFMQEAGGARKPAPTQAGTQQPATQAPTAWVHIGENYRGHLLFARPNGIRSYVQDGVRYTEPVSLRPTPGGMQQHVPVAADKPDEYKVAKPNHLSQVEYTPPKSDERIKWEKELHEIADEWEKLGDPGMAKAIRAGANQPGLAQSNVDFNRQKLAAEIAKRRPDAPKPNETFSLDDFMDRGGTGDRRLIVDARNSATPDAKELMGVAEATAKRLLQDINKLGFTLEESGRNRVGMPEGVLHQHFSHILGSLVRYLKGEQAVRKGYERADLGRVAIDRAELVTQLRLAGADVSGLENPVIEGEVLPKFDPADEDQRLAPVGEYGWDYLPGPYEYRIGESDDGKVRSRFIQVRIKDDYNDPTDWFTWRTTHSHDLDLSVESPMEHRYTRTGREGEIDPEDVWAEHGADINRFLGEKMKELAEERPAPEQQPKPTKKPPTPQIAPPWDTNFGPKPEADTKPGAEPPPEPPPTGDPNYGANNSTFTQEMYEKAKARLRDKLNRLNSGFDAEMMLDGLIMAGYHIESGARRFAEFSKRMVDDLGEKVRPNLDQLYTMVRKQPGFDTKGMDSDEVVQKLIKDHEISTRDPDRRFSEAVAHGIETGLATDARTLQRLAESFYGGTLGQGVFSRDRFYDAIELGVNRYIKSHPELFSPAVGIESAKRAIAELATLKSRMPTQTVRSGEKETHQQFSTPPDYAYAAAWIANLRPTDRVMEPSAGTGGLIVHAMNAGVADTYGNELSDKRRSMLNTLGVGRVTGEDAAQLHNILSPSIKPTAVIMNPPFSAAGERMGDKMVLGEGARHVEQALARLEPGGRLVAIVGRGMAPELPTFKDWWAKIGEKYDVRANVGMDGEIYRKYGTTFPTRVLVIDKVAPSGRPLVTGQVQNAAQLIDALKDIRDDRPDQQIANQPPGDQVAPPGPRPSGPDEIGTGPTGLVGPGQGGNIAPGTGQSQPTVPGGGGKPTGKPSGGRPSNGGKGNSVAGGKPQPGPRGTNGVPDKNPDGSDLTTGSGEGSGGGGIRPGGSGERDEPGVTPPPDAVITTEHSVTDAADQTLSDSVYEPYKPERVKIEGAQPHPGPLVQSAAMASVRPPATTYQPRLPAALIKSGGLSDAQLEAIVYAGNAHSQMLPSAGDEVAKRRGFFIGDGTGVGKGREIAGIMLDNWNNGRKKAVWVSEKKGLVNDARRDWSGVGQSDKDIFEHGRTGPGDAISPKQGIAFTTYDTLKSEEKTPKDGSKPPIVIGSRVTAQTGFGDSKEKGTVRKIDGDVLTVELDDGRTTTMSKAQARMAWKPKTRVDQLVEWLGKDFDGVIAFDESHNLGNSIASRGQRGVKAAAQKAIAGVELQARLPNARVVYVSATGATEVSNLAYADRLGLWGRGTAFPNRTAFLADISSGGIAAMELVARDMKALGHYIARNLSYDGVDYDRIEHRLTDDQRNDYDKLAEAWQIVLQNINDALILTNAQTNGRARSAAMSAFWGTHQRFFNQIITSMQMPAVIRGVEEDLKAGRQAVLQLVNTMEAAQERAVEKAKANDEDLEDLDMTPRDQLMQMVEKSFPVYQYETYIDANGNELTRPVLDSHGNPVENPEAVAMRTKLLQEIRLIRVPDGPLEMLMNHFGTDRVSEVTGRKSRVVRKVDETGTLKTMQEKREGQANISEANVFQEGRKRILVFSEAGGTGRSYHDAKDARRDVDADRKRHEMGANGGPYMPGARRSHYLVQAGWRADKAVQGFGRTHRTNQFSAPIFHLVTTDLDGQKRFISSIARRLGQLGALTKGERRAADQGLFGMRDNLESAEAKSGLRQFYMDVFRGKIEGVTLQTLEDGMGLKLRDQDGNLKTDLPPITTFLNRILSLKIQDQNATFQAFARRFDDAIERAAASGTLDTGVETLEADKIIKKSDQVVYTDEQSGAQTRYVQLETHFRNHPTSFDDTANGRGQMGGRRPIMWAYNKLSGRAFAVSETSPHTDTTTGSITEQYRLTSPMSYQFLPQASLNRGNWTTIDSIAARTAWDKQIAATPEFRKSDLHMITGAVLPIWDRLRGNPQIYRLQTSAGERMLGRVIPNDAIDQTLEALGAEARDLHMTPEELEQRILSGATATLANGWKLKRALVAGDQRIELTGPNYTYERQLQADGVMVEKIVYQTRFFVPTGNPRVLQAVLSGRPVTNISGGGPAEGGGTGEVHFSQGEAPKGWGVADTSTTMPKPEAVQAAANAITAMTGGKIHVAVVDGGIRVTIDGKERDVGGYATGRLIRVAMDQLTVGNLHHEAIHALKNLGVFTPREWTLLENAAKREGWIDKYDIHWRYSHLPEAKQLEEAIAERFRDTTTSKPPPDKTGLITRLMDKLKEWFNKFRSFLSSEGVRTAEDVFERVRSGEIGEREPGSRSPERGSKTIEESRAVAARFDDSLKPASRRAVEPPPLDHGYLVRTRPEEALRPGDPPPKWFEVGRYKTKEEAEDVAEGHRRNHDVIAEIHEITPKDGARFSLDKPFDDMATPPERPVGHLKNALYDHQWGLSEARFEAFTNSPEYKAARADLDAKRGAWVAVNMDRDQIALRRREIAEETTSDKDRERATRIIARLKARLPEKEAAAKLAGVDPDAPFPKDEAFEKWMNRDRSLDSRRGGLSETRWEDNSPLVRGRFLADHGYIRRGAEAMIKRLRLQANMDRAANDTLERQGAGRGGLPELSHDDVREVEDFIRFVGEHMFTDVGLRIMKGSPNVYGRFTPARRMVELFKSAIRSGEVSRTMVHELWHSLESALPSEDRIALTKEFRRRQNDWLTANEWARPFHRGLEIEDQLTGQEARDWIDRFGKDYGHKVIVIDTGVRSSKVIMPWGNENYRYKNRSEYFAESMSDRHFEDRDIQDRKAESIFAHIRDYFRRMVAAIKHLFGRDVTGRIYEGFRRQEYDAPMDTAQMLDEAPSYDARAPGPRPPRTGRRLHVPGSHGVVVSETEGFRRAGLEAQAVLSPTSIGNAKPMEQLARRHGAELAQSYAQASAKLEKHQTRLEKMSKADQLAFTDRMERGQPQPTPELQEAATALREMLDHWTRKIQSLGRGYLRHVIDDYMGHIYSNYKQWKNSQPPPTAAEIEAQRVAAMSNKGSILGSQNWRKRRTFATQADAIAAGLIPITHNPIDLQLMKIREFQKFYHGTRLADQMKETNIARWVPREQSRAATDEGLVMLDDRVFQPLLMGDANPAGFGANNPGNYYAPEAQARIFNRYVSPGWSGKSIWYDTLRAAGNLLNSVQLSMSGFHASFVMIDTAVSRSALGLHQLGRPGQFMQGLGNIATGLTPASVVMTHYQGKKLRAAWLDPDNASPEWRALAESLNMAGGRINMDKAYLNNQQGSFWKHAADVVNNPLSPGYAAAQMWKDAPNWRQKGLVPLKLAMRALDTTMEPTMGWLVPHAKLGVFSIMAKSWQDAHMGATAEERSAEMIKIWDSVENRLGQLTYDNLFWDQRLKDMSFVTARSVGWNLGTERELGGAAVDTGTAAKRISTLQTPELTYRMSYAIMLGITTMMVGALLTKGLTGEWPTDFMDYFYPPTGEADAKGIAKRLSIPGYFKDVVHGIHDPIGMALNKIHPLISMIAQISKNEDYYGGIIKAPGDNYGAYIDFLFNTSQPFAVRAVRKMRSEGAPLKEQLLGFMGFQPAPAFVSNPERGKKFQAQRDKRGLHLRQKQPGRINIFNRSPGQ